MRHVFYFLKQIHGHTGNVLYINVLAMMGIGLLDGIAVLLLIPMISMSGIVNVEAGDFPFASVFSIFELIPNPFALPLILGLYVIIAVGQNLLQRRITIQNAVIQQGFLRYIQLETYHSLLKANWDFFIKKRKSDLINILTAEIGRTNAGTQSFLKLMASVMITIVQVALAFVLSPGITSFVLLCGLLLLFLNRKFLRRSLILGNRNYELGRSFLAGITDQINGIKDIKSNRLEEPRMNWYRSITKQMQDERVEFTRVKTTSQSYYKIASAFFIAIFIMVAVQLFSTQGAQLVLVVVIFSRLWPRVSGIQSSMEQIASTIPSLREVKRLQKETKTAMEFMQDFDDSIQPIRIGAGIECNQLAFRYDKDKPTYALKDINLYIPANHITAIVGKSGAGKSTLIDLVMGLNKPEIGQVCIDGTPLEGDDVLALRKSLSYVSQDPFLFNTTVRENLLLVKPDASEEDLWEALEFALAAAFVRELPDGLDTLIGDRGVKLSGGERQRLVLARAILRKPSILVLDEATSALDTENEAKIQRAIEQLKGKMTIIVIAHRLSTIRNADQVIVLDKGEVVQQGAFQQLADQSTGVFSKLVNQG
ncbi:ABC transporter ATP-binding protein [Aquibacillus albus]|uniref:ATP-binding cassette subfamily C protein n=1 Tax=Aquibacillus albus TaxID=1168171 RepID=A0ABS2N5T7_9BACI|nr:ABC transporter ATP-binding protein [Aquibacillus albus]MBM7573492.1 ATP-binding cassette subfamily C protein [Aquibacillus albus]